MLSLFRDALKVLSCWGGGRDGEKWEKERERNIREHTDASYS